MQIKLKLKVELVLQYHQQSVVVDIWWERDMILRGNMASVLNLRPWWLAGLYQK